MQVFEWDEAKALSNLTKHGVAFEEAESTFLDENHLKVFDAVHSVVEERWFLIATSSLSRVLVTVYTEREGQIRIISSRLASKKERAKYAEHCI